MSVRFDSETAAKLSAKFTAAECKLRSGPGGSKLSYVDQHHVIERLNNSLGIGGWSWEITDVQFPEDAKGNKFVMVRGELRAGDCTHSGVSVEPMRDPAFAARICDTIALKRAARLYGIGLELYKDDEPIHAELEELARKPKNQRQPPQQAAPARWPSHMDRSGAQPQETPARWPSNPAHVPVQQDGGVASCPDCRGPVWDNREKKKQNPDKNWPFFGCKDRGCDWAMWNLGEK